MHICQEAFFRDSWPFPSVTEVVSKKYHLRLPTCQLHRCSHTCSVLISLSLLFFPGRLAVVSSCHRRKGWFLPPHISDAKGDRRRGSLMSLACHLSSSGWAHLKPACYGFFLLNFLFPVSSTQCSFPSHWLQRMTHKEEGVAAKEDGWEALCVYSNMFLHFCMFRMLHFGEPPSLPTI